MRTAVKTPGTEQAKTIKSIIKGHSKCPLIFIHINSKLK
jgi:hypothetical protein